jgi:hypothetical protein
MDRGGLHGYPDQVSSDAPGESEVAKHPRAELGRGVDPRTSRMRIKDLTGWKAPLDPSSVDWATLVFRDRLGFRWERVVGLQDEVSQVEAASLLGVPLMRINRWVRGGTLRSKQLRGRGGRAYSVVLVRDLYELAAKLNLEVPQGRLLVIVESADHEDRNLSAAEGGNEGGPTHKGGARGRKRNPQKLAGGSARRSVGSARVRRGRRGK